MLECSLKWNLLDNLSDLILQIFLILILNKQQFRFRKNQKRFVIQDLIHLMEQISKRSLFFKLDFDFNLLDQLMNSRFQKSIQNLD